MKKFLTVFFTFTLYFNLVTQANAQNVGGWSMSNPVAQGASTVYNGTKQVIIDGKDYIKKGTAIITPTASNVAKTLAKGFAGVALSVAVEQLIGAVDWVLDPANNQIVYTPKQNPDLPTLPKIWVWNIIIGSSAKNLCNQILSYDQSENPSSRAVKTILKMNSSTSATCYLYDKDSLMTNLYTLAYQVNPNYDPKAVPEDKPKTIPLETVAQKVISNASSGDANAQVATTAAAADIVAEAEKDNVKARPIAQQLENSASTKPADEAAAAEANTATGTQTQNPTKPETTDLALEFPAFCGWAPIVCEAAQVAIAFPRLVTGWWETIVEKTNSWATSISESWTAVKEWAKSEESKDTELEIPDPIQPPIDTDISFGGICPADHEAQINMGVGVIKMPISYEPICTTVSTAKPVLIFVGFFIAALIIGGVKTE